MINDFNHFGGTLLSGPVWPLVWRVLWSLI